MSKEASNTNRTLSPQEQLAITVFSTAIKAIESDTKKDRTASIITGLSNLLGMGAIAGIKYLEAKALKNTK